MSNHKAFIDENFVLHKQFAVFSDPVDRKSKNSDDWESICRHKRVITLQGTYVEDHNWCQYDNKKANILYYIEKRIPFCEFFLDFIWIDTEN